MSWLVCLSSLFSWIFSRINSVSTGALPKTWFLHVSILSDSDGAVLVAMPSGMQMAKGEEILRWMIDDADS
jgi:hypothetical protein